MSPLSKSKLREFIREGRSSNAQYWKRSKRNLEFYSNKSWHPDDKRKIEQREQRPIVLNITRPAVDLIVGMLTSNKIDYAVKPLTRNGELPAQDATWALKHLAIVNKLSGLERYAKLDAVIQGCGWVLVGPYVKDRDPTAEKLQLKRLQPRDCFFDLDAKEPSLQDARYMGHSRWISLKTLRRQYPKQEKELEILAETDDPPVLDPEVYKTAWQTGTDVSIPPLQMWDESDWNLADRNGEIDRKKNSVLVHEVYYRDYRPATFLEKQDGTVSEFDPKDVMMLLDPEIKRFFQAEKPIIMRAVLAGPIILENEEWLDDLYPMVPFFWSRDDKGWPFSFVEQIADQQSEINITKAKAVFDLNARAIQVDPAFFDEHSEADLDDIKENAAKPNGVIRAAFEHVQPWSGQNNPQQLIEISNIIKQEVSQASGITENLAGQDAGKSPKSAEASRQKTLQAGVTFEMHKNDFLDAFCHLGEVMLGLAVKVYPDGWFVRVDDNPLTQGTIKKVQPKDIPQLVEIDAGSFSPTMKDKLFETYSMLIAKLPPDAKLQTNALITLFNALDMPGAKDFEALLKEYAQRLDQGQADATPMAAPTHRPRQKRPPGSQSKG
jgi:hypothetical protein